MNAKVSILYFWSRLDSNDLYRGKEYIFYTFLQDSIYHVYVPYEIFQSFYVVTLPLKW
jgi:hypothetical protein